MTRRVLTVPRFLFSAFGFGDGRLLFATTNHIERLDPALSRPGRMDVWVNFKHATKWQAEGIFKCFFPAKHAPAPAPSPPSPTKDKGEEKGKGEGAAEGASKMAESKRERATRTHAIPLLSEDEISDLARRFADAIPENELSVRLPSLSLGFPPLYVSHHAVRSPSCVCSLRR